MDNDSEFKELHDHAQALGYIFPFMVTKTSFDNGIVFTNALMVSNPSNHSIITNDSGYLILAKISSDSDNQNISMLTKIDNTSVTLFNKEGGIKIDNNGSVSTWCTHHSCQCFWPCMEYKLGEEAASLVLDLINLAIESVPACAEICGTSFSICGAALLFPIIVIDDVPACVGAILVCGGCVLAHGTPELASIYLSLAQAMLDCRLTCHIDISKRYCPSLYGPTECHPTQECNDETYGSWDEGAERLECNSENDAIIWTKERCLDCEKEWMFYKTEKWCEEDEVCLQGGGYVKCLKINETYVPPGNDKPDDNYDVSTQKLTFNTTFDPETRPEVAVLFKGFPISAKKLLVDFNEPVSFVSIDSAQDFMEDYPIMIIPSGGLYGLDSLSSFKSDIDEYVKEGGTLIVFSQQHGYEFNALPGGEVSGFGWLEDQSCQHNSVGITTYHPILSGQDSVISDVVVDGYFTKYPENATILLSRTKNGMPAMLMYEYGNGTVIASTIYEDWASTHGQSSRDGKNLVRDMIAWAKDKTEMPQYQPNDVYNTSLNVTNVHLPIPSTGYPQYELGDTVNIPINVTNYANVSSDKVTFFVWNPGYDMSYINVSETIPSNESKIVNFTYPTTNESKVGGYTIFYSLYAGETVIGFGLGRSFTLGVDMTEMSTYNVNFTLTDPDNQIAKQENISVYVPPGERLAVNFTYPSLPKLGIWHLQYDVLHGNDTEIDSGSEKFIVSNYAENPGGFVYKGNEITFGVNSESVNYAYGSNGTFTIQIWNQGDTDKDVTSWWCLPHDYYETRDPIYGTHVSNSPGHKSNLYKTLTVPAHGEVSFVYSVPVLTRDALWAEFYEGDESSYNYLGRASIGIQVFKPSIGIQVETDHNNYAKGENVSIVLDLTKKQIGTNNATATVRVLDPDNTNVFEDTFNVDLSTYGSLTKTYDFTLPITSEVGVYLVSVEANSNGEKIGSGSTNFEVDKSYIFKMTLDKPDKAYNVRENMGIEIEITNAAPVLWSSEINTSIPILSFEDSKQVTLNPFETEKITYNLNIPETTPAGKYEITTNIGFDGYVVESDFFIPESNLVLSLDEGSYNAGDNVSINLTNIGGVDTTYNYSIELYDSYTRLIYANNAVQEDIMAGESKSIGFKIPTQVVSGKYYTMVECEDLNTSKKTKQVKIYDVSGLEASIASATDKKVYFTDENISILADITNLDGQIENGTLNLKIVTPQFQTPGDQSAKITISNTNNPEALTDYQILIELDSSNFNFAKTQPDGADIRFTNFGGNQLPYWIESFDPLNEEAKIWVKVDSIPASDVIDINMYYGGGDAEPVSDGDATFEFFDDFEDESFDTDEWTVVTGSSVVEEDGVLKVTNDGSTAPASVMSNTFTIQDAIMEGNLKWVSTSGSSHMGFYMRNSVELLSRGGSYNDFYWHDGVIKGSSTYDPPANVWHFIQAKFDGPSGEGYLENLETGVSVSNSVTDLTVTGSGKVGLIVWVSGTDWFDDIRVRKYTSPEPAISIETSPASQENWDYYSPITIDNSENTEDLTDYQVLVELNSDNFDFAEAQFGGKDLRFSTFGGDPLNDVLPYWIETFDKTNETAKIWVKVDSIPASGSTTINMYFGNPNADPVASGDDTFEFFDDASYDKTSSYELLKICEHSVGGYLEYQEANNRYYAYPTGDPGQFLRIKDITSMQNFAADVDYAHVHHLSCNQLGFLWGYQNNNQFYSSRPGTCTSPDSIDLIKYDNGLTDITPPKSFSGDVLVLEEWYHLQTKAYDGSFVTSHSLENNSISGTDTTFGAGKIGFYIGSDHTGYDRSEHWFKNVRIRKYTGTDPILEVKAKHPIADLNTATTIWQANMTLNINENETQNIVTDVPTGALADVTGKLGLIATLYNDISYSQLINQSQRYSFFITDKDSYLILETDKPAYKPNETITIYGEVKNNAIIPDNYNLSIKKDDQEIFSDTFALSSGESYNFNISTTSNASFTLDGTVNDVVVTDLVKVEPPALNINVIAPDVVGLEDFDVVTLIENIGVVPVDLNVSIENYTQNLNIPAKESMFIETELSTSTNTTLTVSISGDVNQTIQKEIICAENVKISITPEPNYLEGEVEIPYTIENTETLDSGFNATFSIDNETISKSFFVPSGENTTDSVSFNLTKGAYLLNYVSPFENVHTMINVQSPPEFVVTSIHPENLNFTLAQNVTLTFVVKNTGGSEGEVSLSLFMPDFEDMNRTWVRPGEEENISFNFTIPDDLEEKSYKGIYEIDGETNDFSFFAQGAKISVDASLDKDLYEAGETAILTLDVENENDLELGLYARVHLDEYDEVIEFNLTDSETLQFNVPVVFNGQKLFYGIYMDSGRALHLNSIYIQKKEGDVTLYTDKQVYDAGENVSIFVDMVQSGTVDISAPNFNTSIIVTGPNTLEFSLPEEMRSGTYYIDYSFDNLSFAYPFDVVGYSARIIECSLDKEMYNQSDVITAKMNVEVNQNISGALKMWTYDSQSNIIDTIETYRDFTEGENKIELPRILSTNFSGIHVLVYSIYANNDSILLASGAEYFDVKGLEDITPPASITNLINTTYEQTYINWTWTNPEDADFDYVMVYIDGEWKVNTSAQNYNATNLIASTAYEISTHAVDTSGNINSTWVNHTATTAAIPDNTAPVANANGPYMGNESTPIILDGSGSYDPDDDELHYRWDFRNDGTWDTDWSSSPTADYTWDDDWTGTAKLEVSDGELNDTDTAIVTVNNVPPTITSFTGSLDPVQVGNGVSLNGTFTDPGLNDTHTATFDWDDNTTTDYALINGEREITGTHTYTEAGVYKVTLTIEDDDGGVDSEVFRYIVIYDPEGGFVTGGGWIISPEGAYAPDPTLAGKANFGFVSKYKKGQQTPTGNTEFQFKAGDLNFHSSDYDWLVIAGHKAMYKGTGTINGAGNYGFMISAIDEDLTPSTDVDLFRIKIWDKDNGDAIVYDNLMGADDDADPTTEIGGGQIKIHKQN